MSRSRTGKILTGGGRSRNYGVTHTYDNIIAIENLLEAWKEFIKGKSKRIDVQVFQLRLMDNIHLLHDDLKSRRYRHGSYHGFKISDPKPRDIHKARVRDRLVHHAIHRILYPFFDQRFIVDSYSCRVGKGAHRAINKFRSYAYTVSRNHTRTCWVLKCDIRKFFATIDHEMLKLILVKSISDNALLALLINVIESFSVRKGKGLPLGNLTSQLLVNIYMNEFDQFVKHDLKVKCFIRYADDFVILSDDCAALVKLLPKVSQFLSEHLKLSLHPDKVFMRTYASGVDFLGWVHFPDHRVLRASTKRRMLRNISARPDNDMVRESYRGMLSHGNSQILWSQIQNIK